MGVCRRWVPDLNEDTYIGADGKLLADEIRAVRKTSLPVVLVHENDDARRGCAFKTFFETTPQDLIDGGLYRAIAVAFMSGEAHRRVSHTLLAQRLGAATPNASKGRCSLWVRAESARLVAWLGKRAKRLVPRCRLRLARQVVQARKRGCASRRPDV